MALSTKVLVAAALGVPLLLFPGATPQAEEGTYSVWWSPSLELESLDEIDKRLARKLWLHGGEIDVSKGGYRTGKKKVIDTCISAIELSKKGYQGLNNPSHKVLLFQLARCRAIELLKKARPAKRSYVMDFVLDHNAVDDLPAMVEVGPGCDWLCRQGMANEKRIPWGQFVDIVSVDMISGHEIEVLTLGWSTTVKILARADFDGDGLEDLLMWANAGATEGTWGATEIYVLSRDRPGSVLWVLDAYEYLCREYQCQNYYDYPEALRWSFEGLCILPIRRQAQHGHSKGATRGEGS